MTRIADKIWERLKSEVKTVYLVPGGSSMFLVDALGRSGIRHVSMMHEQAAGFAAIGEAMLTGKIGVCLTSAGPSATNAITACAAAWTDSVPVLFISGQARTDTLVMDSKLRTRGAQEIDIIPIVKPITKRAYQPMTSGMDCLLALDDMILECMDGRCGPCWLSIPQDISGREI